MEGRRLESRQVARAARRAAARSPRRRVWAWREPTLRFFAKKNSGLLSTLVVSVYVKTSLGLVVPVPVGVVLGNGSGRRTAPMLIVANLLPLLPGDRTPGGLPVHAAARRLADRRRVRRSAADRARRADQRARSFRLRVRSSCFSTTLAISLRISGGPVALTVPGLERLAPVPDRALAGELVEVRARHREADLCVGRDVLGDLRPGHLDAEELDVTAAAQLELHDELELLERRNLLLEVSRCPPRSAPSCPRCSCIKMLLTDTGRALQDPTAARSATSPSTHSPKISTATSVPGAACSAGR